MQSTVPEGFIAVVVGVVNDSDGRFLVTRRPWSKAYGGKWEFPGGKIEFGETAWQALVREFCEELGLVVREGQSLFDLRHIYPDRRVVLDVWQITRFERAARPLEGQEIRWVSLDKLDELDFLDGNRELLTRLRAHYVSMFLADGR
jgi:8-oxo-dGTP diphosphatase